jgi:Calcineurin-like phosphoesterase
MTTTSPLSRAACGIVLAVALLTAPAAAARQQPSRIVAVGDVHGAYEELVALLQSAGLIDSRRAWSGGTATFVQTGDVVDRGKKERECLDLLMDLQRQAPRDGGTVIPLLGNHEVMNVIGDLRYATPTTFRAFAGPESEKRRDTARKDYLAFLSRHAGHGHEVVPPADGEARQKWLDEHPIGFFEHRDAFGPGGPYGKWIRSNRAVVQVGDGVFVHGGINPALEFGSVSELDERVTSDLPAFDAMWKELVDAGVIWHAMTFAEAVRFAAEELTWQQAEGPIGVFGARLAVIRLLAYKTWITVSGDGPLWYRGLSTEPEGKLDASLTAMLERLKASYIVAGHSVVASKQVTTRFGSRVFLIDTGMLGEVYSGRASALEIRDGRFTALQVDALPRLLPPPASAKVAAPAR